jgi:hypothetical protein
MKMKTLKLLPVLAVAIGLFAAPTLRAKESTDAATLKQSLTGVSPLELPAKAASLVAQAGAKEKELVTEAVVKAAVSLNPAATPAIVGAIAKNNPSMASRAATMAAELQPKQLALIAKAAVGGAPAQATEIVAALCKQSPTRYNVIAVNAAQAIPASGREILDGVANGIPSLQSYLDKASKGLVCNTDAVVAQVIDLTIDLVAKARHDQLVGSAVLGSPAIQTVNAADPILASLPAPRPVAVPAPPVLGPPFAPPPPIVIEIGPGNTSPEQSGGHNYVAP